MFITNKNIAESLVRSLQNSFTSQTNCEVTLMCEGKTLKCHRHVLVLHSTHFANLFRDQNAFPSAVAVVNMKFSHLKSIVDYMYFGRIKLQEDSEEMQQIIKCAEDLGLAALVQFITLFLKNAATRKAANQCNGSANLSSNDLNGDDSLMKRKRASDINNSRVAANDSYKKPKLNETGPLIKASTPLREPLKSIKGPVDIKVSSSDNSETLVTEKKRRSDDDEANDEETKRRLKDEEDKKKKREEEDRKKKLREEEERQRKHEEECRRKEEEERRRREEEKQRAEEERRRKAEEEKQRRAKEAEEKRKSEEAEKHRLEEERKRKAAEKKRQEEEAARKAEEEKTKKETKCDESTSTKSCAVCNKQYKDNVEHRKIQEGITLEKKCIIAGCERELKFRRQLIDHLRIVHKIDVCDG